MKQISASLLAISFIFFMTGCSKEKDNAPAVKTKTQLITTNTWKFSSATWGGADAGPLLQACQKDNIMVFYVIAAGATTATGMLDEGATKCNAADAQTRAFDWSFQSGETMLMVSTPLFTGGSNTFTIVSLTESQLVLSQMITLGSTTQNAVVTFVH